MDVQTQLVGAVIGLWGVLTAVVSGALKWLLEDRKQLQATCAKQVTDLETKYTAELARKDAKLDEAADLAVRQAQSQQNQIELQQRTIEALQAALNQRPAP